MIKNLEWLRNAVEPAIASVDLREPEEGELQDRFEALCVTLAQVGVPHEQQAMLWQLLTGLLYLGNVSFNATPSPNSTAEREGEGTSATTNGPQDGSHGMERAGVSASASASLDVAASLLGVDAGALAFALTHKEITAGGGASLALPNLRANGGDFLRSPLSAGQAAAVQLGTAQGVYSALFAWLVRVINAGGKRAFIGVIDLFGFEALKSLPSSLEQLCINAANERIQRHFNQVLLSELLRELRAEGLSERSEGPTEAALGTGAYAASNNYAASSVGGSVMTDGTGVMDARSCIGLLEQPGVGLFALLDTQSALAAGTDSMLLSELRHGPVAQHRKLRLPVGTAQGFDFAVAHYAGEVRYSCEGLVAKNRDPMPEHVAALLRGSSNALLASLFVHTDVGGGSSQRAAARNAARRSVSAKFRKSLSELMQTVGSTSSHFVRCIKPNSAGVPGVFDKALVVHQLRCAGVLEIARIYSTGFPVRMPFADVVADYGAAYPPARRLVDTHPVEAVVLLLGRAGIDPALYRLGKTKLFAR